MHRQYFVYVLKSEIDASLYVGYTNDLQDRLIRHARGECRFTKGRRPWKLVNAELFKSRSQAIKRERQLKTGFGREELDKFR